MALTCTPTRMPALPLRVALFALAIGTLCVAPPLDAAASGLTAVIAVPQAKPALANHESATQAIAHLIKGDTPIPGPKPDITGSIDVLAYADADVRSVPVPSRPPLGSNDEDATRTTGIAAPDSRGSLDKLKAALVAVDKRDISTAMAIRGRMPPSLDRRIIDWAMIVTGNPAVSSGFITEFAREAPHWPNAKLMRRRAEVAFAREKPSDAAALAAYRGAGPITLTGKLTYAHALLDTGRKNETARIIRAIWREDALSNATEKRILRNFGSLLRKSDHDRRVEMLLYKENTGDALTLAKRLSRDAQAYVKARVAVIRRQKNQSALMKAVPRSQQSRPGYIFAKIQMLRRAGDKKAAIALMLKAPTKRSVLVNTDEWWIERRLESRNALDLGKPRAAYKIAAEHAAQSPGKYAEAEFHAGWYALRFLNDPREAQPHFRNIARIATTPITSSRADYWLGRTAQAQGDKSGAKAAYARAAIYGSAYYGQLARAKLGMVQATVPPVPRPSASDRLAFNQNELVRAIRRLTAAGQFDETRLLFRALALTLSDAAQVALLADMAETRGKHQMALMVGKLAARRNNDAAALAFPTAAIPKSAKIAAVEKPVVYAIARQESAFNPRAVSHAGAMGLLQLMPGTAKMTAKKAGMKYSKSALTSNPGYNATLGAAHLDELIDEFDGSYIMSFAAYNAGRRRVYEWIERFGDPRSGKVDPVDWVERIPFTETRNYVQRITENLQVYRARLNGKGLSIVADLSRGGAPRQ